MQDVGVFSAIVLASPSNFAGHTYSLTASPYSHNELAAAFSQVLQQSVTYKQVSIEQAHKIYASQGFSAPQIQGMMEVYSMIAAGNKLVTSATSDYRNVAGMDPTTIQQWTRAFASAFRETPSPFASDKQVSKTPSRIVVVGAETPLGSAVVTALSHSNRVRQIIAVMNSKADSQRAEVLGCLAGVSVHYSIKEYVQKGDVICIFPGIGADRQERSRAAVEAAISAKASSIVAISVLLADLLDTKLGRVYGQFEQHVRSSGLPYIIARVAPLLDSMLQHIPTIKSKSIYYSALSASRLQTSICLTDASRAIHYILNNPLEHKYATYRLTAPPFTQKLIVDTLSEVKGAPVSLEIQDFESILATLSREMVLSETQKSDLVEYWKLVEAESITVNTHYDDLEKLTGREALSADTWIRECLRPLLSTGARPATPLHSRPKKLVVLCADSLLSLTVLQILATNSPSYFSIVAVFPRTGKRENREAIEGLRHVTVVCDSDIRATLQGAVTVLYPVRPRGDSLAGLQERVQAVLDEALLADVRLILLSSSISQLPNDETGKIFKNLEDLAVSQLGEKTAIVRVPALYESLWSQLRLLQSGNFVAPMDPSTPITVMGLVDVAYFCANLLLKPSLVGQTVYSLGGPEPVTAQELCARMSRTWKTPIKYSQRSVEECVALYVSEGSTDAQAIVLAKSLLVPVTASASDFQRVTAIKPTRFKSWTKSVVQHFR